jgi:hypothetical protein
MPRRVAIILLPTLPMETAPTSVSGTSAMEQESGIANRRKRTKRGGHFPYCLNGGHGISRRWPVVAGWDPAQDLSPFPLATFTSHMQTKRLLPDITSL